MSLLCFGSPLIDIIASVDDSCLKKYGLTPDNATRALPSHQPMFEEILSYKHKILPGGSVTNTARVFQWITKTPQKVVYVGTIGRDRFGKMIKEKLKEEFIYPYLLEHANMETGKCAVLVSGNDKHRSLVTDLGASKKFDVQNLSNPDLQHIIKSCKLLYISTFFLGVSTEVVKELITQFKAIGTNKQVVVNLGASFLCQSYPEEVKFMVFNADLLIGNEKEFLSLAQLCGTYLPEENLEQNIINTTKSHIFNQKTTDNLLVITRGSDSIITYQNGKMNYYEVESVKNIVDTNGAGDAFIGGFLAKMVENSTLDECIKCGKWCAQNILQCTGCDFDNKLVYE